MAVQWQWIPPVMLPWSDISLYPHYADVDWIGSEFGYSKSGHLPRLPGKRWPNYGGCYLGSSSPIEVMCRGPPALRTCHLAIFFCGGTSKEKCTSTGHEIFLSWRMQLRRNCAPYLAESVHQLLSEAERVRQKPGSSFKRRYFSYLSMFWNIRMVFLHCNITCVY